MTKYLQLVHQVISSLADFIGEKFNEENASKKRVIPQYVYIRTNNKNQL